MRHLLRKIALNPVLLLLPVITIVPACMSNTPQNFRPAGLQRVESESAAGGSNLLYATDEGSDVYVYAYPNGKLVKKLTLGLESTTGECVDNAGDVFITGYNGHKIFVYAHGRSRPMQTLDDPGYPVGCAIDPTTQNLAVANAMSTGAGPGNVAVWTHANGFSGPVIYSNLQFLEPAWCSYDDKGNLFVDGADYSERNSSLAELPRGAPLFHNVKLGFQLVWPAPSVQWDGKHVTVAAGNTIYRLSVSGFKARVVGSTQLGLSWGLSNYFIAGIQRNNLPARELVAVSVGKIGIFDYPSGTGPMKIIKQNYPLDAVVSPF